MDKKTREDELKGDTKYNIEELNSQMQIGEY